MVSYRSSLLIITKLCYVIGHGHSSHSHTSHSHTSHTSHISNTMHKPFIIKSIVVPTIINYYVFTQLYKSIKNDFEENEIYWVFNISSLVLNNNGQDCIYYSFYPNKNNETIIVASSDVINFNISIDNSSIDNNSSTYCVKNSYDYTYFPYITIFVIVFAVCLCRLCHGFCEQDRYDRSSSMY